MASATRAVSDSDVGTLAAATTSLFLASIFYGDVWLGITVPSSMLLAPFVGIAWLPLKVRKAAPWAALPLLGLVSIIFVQALLGHPPKGKLDAVVYLPLVYAVVTIAVLRRAQLTTAGLAKAIFAGGGVSVMVMAWMALAVPSDLYIVPGQDILATAETYRQLKTRDRPSPTLSGPVAEKALAVNAPVGQPSVPPELQPSAPIRGAPPLAFEPTTLTSDMRSFYKLKATVRNALGQSNYIAVFLVFLTSVALFGGYNLTAALFAIASAATLSRFGIVFLLFVAVVYLMQRLTYSPRRVALTLAAVALACWPMLFVFRDSFVSLPGMASLEVRSNYWLSGVDGAALSPWIGQPRQYVLDSLGVTTTWNPHNSVLFLVSIFGLFGLAFYLAYVAIALRTIFVRAATSSVWTGVFVGLLVALVWSTVEIVVMTPAFEVLLASMCILARNDFAPTKIPELQRY